MAKTTGDITTDRLKQLSIRRLLGLHSAAIGELRARRVLRSKNNPVGDYCEWLVARALGLELVSKSTPGYDAVDRSGVRYQIKGRRITSDNKSTLLGAIRNLAGNKFDYLIGVLFDEQFQVVHAAQIPHGAIGQYAKFQQRTNSFRVHLQGKLLDDPQVKDVTAILAAAPVDLPQWPERLSLFVGGYMGNSYGVRLENDRIAYERYDQGYARAATDFVLPSEQDWTAFAQELDRLKAWQWKPTYRDPKTVDGTNWSVDISLGGNSLKSVGSNAFPIGFKAFCSAVTDLLGGRPFA